MIEQFVNGLRSTYGSKYGMSNRDYTTHIKVFGMPDLAQDDPYGAQMAALTKASKYYNQLGDWKLVAFAWSAGLTKAMEIKTKYGGDIERAKKAESRYLVGAAVVRTIMGNVSSAPASMPDYGYQPQKAPVQQVVVNKINIPQAPAVNAQAEVDAYVQAATEQEQAKAEAEVPSARQNAIGVFQTLSNMVRMGSSGGMNMSAPPSQQLDPSSSSPLKD